MLCTIISCNDPLLWRLALPEREREKVRKEKVGEGEEKEERGEKW